MQPAHAEPVQPLADGPLIHTHAEASLDGLAEDLHRQAAIAQTKVGLLMRVKTRATMNQDDPGVPAASPYINIINQQAKIMLKAASELGFSPVSRPRIFASTPSPGLGFSAGIEAKRGEGWGQRSLADYLASAPQTGRAN